MNARLTAISFVLVAVVIASCGTRDDRDNGAVGDSPITSAEPGNTVPSAEGQNGVPGAALSPTPDPSAVASGMAAVGSKPLTQQNRMTTGSMVPTARSSEGEKSGVTPRTGSQPVTGGASSHDGPGTASAGTSGGGSTPALPPPPAGTSPLTIASIGMLSGVTGTVCGPQIQTVQIWVKDINERGGLNGHPVRVLVYDDGSDPARHKAQAQEAVEQRGAVAFVGNCETLSGQGTVAYVTTKRIPVIGAFGGLPWSYTSPMYFPIASESTNMTETFLPSVASQAIPRGKRKLAVLVCAEADACKEAGRFANEQAKGLGFDLVYSGQASLVQPDFTPECLAARNAGADVFFTYFDPNGSKRVAASCARQDFRPVYGMANQIIDDMKNDPNFDGAMGPTQVFPFFQSNTPATAEYQRAFRAYGKTTPGLASAFGWTAGKLMEKAGARLTEPPTSEAILAGLWSLQHEDLGGLTYPLSFTRDKPATPKTCWFDLIIQKGAWTTPDDYKLHCLQ